jgi:ribosomal protein S11
MIKGAGSERDAALLGTAKSGVRLSCIPNVTHITPNECQPPKFFCKRINLLLIEIKDSMIK